MADEIRFAIIGTGMGYGRARRVTETPGARLVAVCSLDEERGRKAAEEFGCEFIRNYEDVLARHDVDVVGIMTPSGLHCEHAIQALQAGKHVYTTKPMDIRLEQCDAAIAAAREAGRLLCVDFDSRYVPDNHRIRQALRSGAIGPVLNADLRMKWYRKQSYYDGGVPPGWRSRRATEGGSAANQAVHYLDLLLWWLGPVESVQARIGTLGHAIETEDAAQALITFKSGAWGVIQTTTCSYPELGTAIELTGRKGTLSWKDNEVVRYEIEDGEPPSLNSFPVDHDLPKNIIEDVVGVLTRGRKPMCPPEEGRASVALFDAIYRSAHTGERTTPE
jgi:predicted dehydrogenase